MLTFAQIGISVFGVLSFLLVTREERHFQIWGTVFGLISNPFWWLTVIATEQWLTVPMHLAYTYGWVSKAYRLYRPNSQSSSENSNDNDQENEPFANGREA